MFKEEFTNFVYHLFDEMGFCFVKAQIVNFKAYANFFRINCSYVWTDV